VTRLDTQADIQVLADAAGLARVAADAVVRFVQDAIVNRGRAAVALSGGSTPGPVLALLARPPNSTRLDFWAIHFFFADERCVPPADERSNYGQARRVLFEPAHVAQGNVHRIRGELGPADAADDYQRELRTFFDEPWLSFDLVLLGLGRDGHTASLFPGDAALEERTAWAAPARSPAGVRDRVTLTLPAINHAAQVVFLVSGPDKADAVARAIGGDTSLPATAVQPINGRVRWLLDASAAGRLNR